MKFINSLIYIVDKILKESKENIEDDLPTFNKIT